MLVTRHAVTEQSPWSISKFETAFRKSAEKLRMSNNFDTTQSDWQAQYSFLPPGDNLFSQSYEHVSNPGQTAEQQAQPRTVDVPTQVPKPESSPLGHRVDPLGLRQPKQPSPIPEQPEVQGNQYPPKSELTHEESSASTETQTMSLGSNQLSSASSGGHTSETAPSHSGNEGQNAGKEDDEEVIEDEEMADGEHQTGDSQQQQQQQQGQQEQQQQQGQQDQQSQPQTAAERTAQRRKMKRFRYVVVESFDSVTIRDQSNLHVF
jgi:hypothetical protein